MKSYKNLYTLLFLAVIASCTPLQDDVNEVINNSQIVKEVSFTMTSDDYEDLEDLVDDADTTEAQNIARNENFGSDEAVRKFIPLLLEDKYPQLGEKSSALVTYDLYRGSAPAISDYTRAFNFVLGEAEYESVDPEVGDAGFFNNQFNADDYLTDILANADTLSDAVDGEIISVSYEYNEIEYQDISGEVIFSEDFSSGDLSAYDVVSVEGPQEWEPYSSSAGYQAARMSAFDGGAVANEDWLIVPTVDLTNNNAAVLKLDHVVNFLGAQVLGTDLAVKIATDYNGTNAATANWVNLDLDQWPAGDSYDRIVSEASLADYGGETISIAFYYKSTTSDAPQWRLVDILVEEGEAVPTLTVNDFYTYNAAEAVWEKEESVAYYLNDADYDEMGAPGNFNNFSSSTPASDYLPTLMNRKFPYALEEQEIIVAYKYYSSSAGAVQTRGDLLTFMNGSWSIYQSVVEQSLQFGVENGAWVPDNTIRYAFTTEDYSAVAANDAIGNAEARSNLGSYGNFNINGGYWTTSDIVDAIDFILQDKFADVSVEGQKFIVVYDTYPLGEQSLSVIFEGGRYVLNE